MTIIIGDDLLYVGVSLLALISFFSYSWSIYPLVFVYFILFVFKFVLFPFHNTFYQSLTILEACIVLHHTLDIILSGMSFFWQCLLVYLFFIFMNWLRVEATLNSGGALSKIFCDKMSYCHCGIWPNMCVGCFCYILLLC